MSAPPALIVWVPLLNAVEPIDGEPMSADDSEPPELVVVSVGVVGVVGGVSSSSAGASVVLPELDVPFTAKLVNTAVVSAPVLCDVAASPPRYVWESATETEWICDHEDPSVEL